MLNRFVEPADKQGTMGRSTTHYQSSQERVVVPLAIALILVVVLALLAFAVTPEIARISSSMRHLTSP